MNIQQTINRPLTRFTRLTLFFSLIGLTISAEIPLHAQGATADGSTTDIADSIAVYSWIESSRGKMFTQAETTEIYDPSTGNTTVFDKPGQRVKSATVIRRFVVLNLSTKRYRQVGYYTVRRFDPETGRVRTFREFAVSFSGEATPNCLFETDALARRNYLVLSLEGTGTGFANCSSVSDTDGSYNASARIATLSGLVRHRRVRTKYGPYDFLAPTNLKGETGYEYQLYRPEQDSIHRYIRTGKKKMTLHVRLTRQVYEMGAGYPTMDDAQLAIVDLLTRKGYVDVAPAQTTSP